MLLQDKVAIVTGSSRGLGFATASLFAREGAKVVIADLRIEDCEKAAGEIRAAGGEALAIACDVSDEAAVQAMVDRTCDEFGTIDILVNNAGISVNALFLETELADWRKVIDVNLTGAFLCAQRAARVMAAKGYGRIVNICSISGQRGGVGRAAYGSAKAGLEMLTRVMAVELGEQGIRVNAIAPGPVETEMTRLMHTPATRESYFKAIPLRRYGETEDIAQGALFLVSDRCGFVHGHTLNIDGGMVTAGLMYGFDAPAAKTF